MYLKTSKTSNKIILQYRNKKGVNILHELPCSLLLLYIYSVYVYTQEIILYYYFYVKYL